MTTIQNRRRHPRLPEEDRVAVTVLTAREAPELEKKTFFCSTRDISAGGLRLLVSVRALVPVGAVLILRVAFNSPLRAFRQIGRVVWWRRAPTGAGRMMLGVEFDESACASMAAWRGIIERKLEHGGGASGEQP